MARHSSTCCFRGPKFRCIRSTPMARLSSREKCLECFASTGVYTPETMFPNRERDALELGFCSPVGRKSFTNAGLEAAVRHVVAYVRLPAKRQSTDKCRHYVDLLSRRSAEDLVPFLYAASALRPSSCVARSRGRVEFGPQRGSGRVRLHCRPHFRQQRSRRERCLGCCDGSWDWLE